MKQKAYIIDNKELMSEWDWTANAELDPKRITVQSKKSANWICTKCGHKWAAVIGNRASNHTGCPLCANRVCVPGKNDLTSVFPEIAKEWHPTKNGDLLPQMFTYGTKKNVWWKCGKCGHEYQTAINHRTNRSHKSGCPLCSISSHAVSGINDLGTEYPEIGKEWNWNKNDNLIPNEFKSSSYKYVWWKCKGCSYEWRDRIINRVKGKKCPNCADKYEKNVYPGVNDLATTHPEVAAEWHPSKNEKLTPKDVKAGTSKTVWWTCKKCGYEWQRSVRNQVETKTGCPFCCGRVLVSGITDLETIFPEIAAEWHPSKNEKLTPKDVMAGSHKKVWWQCKKRGHEWQAMIYSRTREHQGCPKCSTAKQTSFPEQAVLYYIKMFFADSINRYKADFLGRMELDIYIPSIKCAIEYDGEAWHRENKLEQEKKKYSLCKKHGITLIRIREGEANITIGIADKQYQIDNPHDTTELDAVIKDLIKSLNHGNLFEQFDSVDTEKDRKSILEMYRVSADKNSLSALYPELVQEWNFDKNHPLLPEYFTPGTKEKIWWKCSKCCHEWQATVLHRTKSNSGCPVCANKTIVSGINDLATTHPELAKDFDKKRNGDLAVDKVTFGSGKQVWWKCHKCNYEWQAPVNRRSSMNTGCPACLGRNLIIGQTDLLTKDPVISKIWHPSKNGEVTPEKVHAGSHTSAWWKCDRCGHEWQKNIREQVKVRKCPCCAKKF